MAYKINIIYKTMSHTTHIERKRLKTKERILRVALEIVSEKGLDGLTLQRLAKELDLTAGALYRYFRGKDQIVSAMEEEVLRQMAARLSTTLASINPASDAADAALLKLWACADFYLRQQIDHPAQARLISALLGDSRHHVRDEDLSGVGEQFFTLFVQLVSVMQEAEATGALVAGDPKQRALVFWSSLQGVTTLDKLARVDPVFFDSTTIGHVLTSTLLSGWGADPSRVSALAPKRATPTIPPLETL